MLITYINHSQQKANTRIRWSKWTKGTSAWLSVSAHELFDKNFDGSLVMEYEASRDIEPGEEIFLEYGEQWAQAWEEHENAWDEHDTKYISADDFILINKDDTIRTQSEQTNNPYPSNLRTACFFSN